jgi:hypothetical protein
MPVTLMDLAACLPTLDPRAVTVLARSVLGLRTAEQQQDVSLFDQIRAGLWEFMTAVGFVTDAQRRKVLDFVTPALTGVLPVYQTGGPWPVVHVTFADQRWVACPMQAKWYDMLYDEYVEELPEPAVLLVTCDVTAMFRRQRAWLARLTKGGTDAGPQREHHAAGDGGPGADGRGP